MNARTAGGLAIAAIIASGVSGCEGAAAPARQELFASAGPVRRMLPTSRYYETLVRVQNAGLEAYREVYVKCLFLDAYGAIVADGSGLITNLAARSTDATTVQGSPDTRPPVSAECRVNAAVK